MKKLYNMEIIDWNRKGNVVRFYLGKNGNQWGDDWDDSPYEHNAGGVYPGFIEGHYDLQVSYDYTVIEPDYNVNNSKYSKQDMIDRVIPCVIVVDDNDLWDYQGFDYYNSLGNVTKYYFGDTFQFHDGDSGTKLY